MFYCKNLNKHHPEFDHSPNGECSKSSCRWTIVDMNYDVDAILAVGMRAFVPVFDKNQIELRKRKADDPVGDYLKLRNKYLHFKDVLAADFSKT